jgi:hypothetical protein
MSGGDKKTYKSFLFVKDANLMTLQICGGMFLLQRETPFPQLGREHTVLRYRETDFIRPI